MSGPSLVAGSKGSPGSNVCKAGDEARQEIRGHRALDDHPAGGIAALPGGEARAVRGGLGRLVEVGVGADDKGVAAPEFEREVFGEIGRQLFRQRPPDGGLSR